MPIAGQHVVKGGNRLVDGPVNQENIVQLVKQKVIEGNYAHVDEHVDPNKEIEPATISRQRYAEIYGPTTGDRVRLGDTGLLLEVEKDFTTYGDECKKYFLLWKCYYNQRCLLR